MDKTMKTIFRSWNWPSNENNSFSKRPTPYNISRTNCINPGTVYRSWNFMFDRGYVSNVILRPTSIMIERNFAVIVNVPKEEVDIIISKFSKAYFVEMIHTGLVFEASGVFRDVGYTGRILMVEIVNTSPELLDKQLSILSELINNKNQIHNLYTSTKTFTEKLDTTTKTLIKLISYKDIYLISTKALANLLGESRKTVSRKLDFLLRQNFFSTFPVLNQSNIVGFNLYLINILVSANSNATIELDKAFKIPSVSENYLLYRIDNTSILLLMSYDSIGEMDRCVKELRLAFLDFIVLNRFETVLNNNIDIIM